MNRKIVVAVAVVIVTLGAYFAYSVFAPSASGYSASATLSQGQSHVFAFTVNAEQEQWVTIAVACSGSAWTQAAQYVYASPGSSEQSGLSCGDTENLPVQAWGNQSIAVTAYTDLTATVSVGGSTPSAGASLSFSPGMILASATIALLTVGMFLWRRAFFMANKLALAVFAVAGANGVATPLAFSSLSFNVNPVGLLGSGLASFGGAWFLEMLWITGLPAVLFMYRRSKSFFYVGAWIVGWLGPLGIIQPVGPIATLAAGMLLGFLQLVVWVVVVGMCIFRPGMVSALSGSKQAKHAQSDVGSLEDEVKRHD